MDKESKSPLVSVITPAFNRVDLLLEAMNSAKRQTYRPIELIVVDDGSNEPVKEAVEDFTASCDFDVSYIRQENSGPGIARRAGLQHAKGEFIQYLDSDDEILPRKIQLQVKMMLAHPEAVMCYTITLHVSKDGKRTKRRFSDLPARNLLSTALQYRRWHTSSCLWHYPDKSIAYWANLYNGEDLVHDVSVGIHYRKILFLAQALTLAKGGETEQVSAASQDIQRLIRMNKNRHNAHILVFQLVAKHGFLNYPEYAEPLAEGLYHAGVVLATWGDIERSISLLTHIPKASPGLFRILQSRIAILVVRLTKGRSRFLNRCLFCLHRFVFKRIIVTYG